MNFDKLSPGELDGLLGQKGTEEKPMSANHLLQIEKEAFSELLAVSLSSAAGSLGELLKREVSVSAPVLEVKPRDAVLAAAAAPFFVILGEYKGEVEGIQLLAVSKADVEALVKIWDATSEPDDMEKQFEMLQKLVETMFAPITKTMGMLMEKEVAYSLSGMDIVQSQEDFPIAKFTKEQWFAEAVFKVQLGAGAAAEFSLCLPVQLVKEIAGVLTGAPEEDYAEETRDMEYQSNNQTASEPKKNTAPTIQSVQFSNFDETATSQTEPNNLDMLMDIPLQVTVELGRTKRMVKEILGVSPGSIIELDKLAGEPVDILINNKVIAVGEVVVIDENFGVRVTDILSTADRLSKLR